MSHRISCLSLCRIQFRFGSKRHVHIVPLLQLTPSSARRIYLNPSAPPTLKIAQNRRTFSNKMKFKPEHLIAAPRRSVGVPNSCGSHVIYTTSTYSIEAKRELKEIKVMDLKTRQSALFSDNPEVQSPQWLVGNAILWHQKIEGDRTQLWIGDAVCENKRAYKAGEIEALIDNVQTKVLDDGTIVVAFTALVGPDGDLVQSPPKNNQSSAREYETAKVRYWDQYLEAKRSSLWYTTLIKNSDGDKYQLRDDKPINAFQNTEHELPWCSSPLGEAGSYDISSTGIIFNTLNPEHNYAHRASLEAYFIPLKTFTELSPTIQTLRVPHYEGSSTSTVFSPDGSMAAFTKVKDWQREEDGSKAVFVWSYSENKIISKIQLFANHNEERWELRPDSVLISNDGNELYVTAQFNGNSRLFKVPIRYKDGTAWEETALPIPGEGSISSVHRLGDTSESISELFFTKSSMIDSSVFCILNLSSGDVDVISSATGNGNALGLSSSQISDFWYEGESRYKVQAWMLKPSDFDSNKTYPLALLVHGGPQSAWINAWSTRWNPAIFAEQGYVVVLPNITGSTGFGLPFTQAVTANWGGRPYRDLENCFSYVESQFTFVDTTRAVALGGSYGGYMMNWIAGKPLAKRFRTLVNHNGIFSMVGMYASDITYDLPVFMGGELWESPEKFEQYDPSRYTQNWTQPMLIIHSDNDFRCTISEGLAPHNICQHKDIPSRFLNFPDENHFVQKRENSLHWYRTVLGWINKYAGVEGGVVLRPPISEVRRVVRK